ncbi:hypothetical protein STEG23_016372 [Scotinomys teguina]
MAEVVQKKKRTFRKFTYRSAAWTWTNCWTCPFKLAFHNWMRNKQCLRQQNQAKAIEISKWTGLSRLPESSSSQEEAVTDTFSKDG